MFTYIMLNLFYIATLLIVLRLKLRMPSKPWFIMCICLLVLTLIFDSLMIGLGFFYYAPDKILGIRVGNAPVEDFFYAIFAAIIVPALWYKLEKK